MAVIETIGIDIKSNLEETDKQLSDIDSKLDKLNRKKVELQFKEDKFEKASQHLTDIDNQIKRLSAQKLNIQANTKGVDNAEKKLTDIDTQLKELRSRKLYIQANLNDLTDAHKEFNQVEKEIKSLNKQKVNVEANYTNLEKMGSALDGVSKKISSVNKTPVNLSSIGSKFESFGGKLLNILNPFEGKLGSITRTIASGLGFTALAGIAQNAIGSISGLLESAVSRYDTLNNSLRVFENIGIEASIVTVEMDHLNESISGLPTSLNDAVQSVQLLTSTNQDMNKSIKIYRAINDAVLGFGGTTEQASNAVLQLSQNMAGGQIYAQTWNSLLNSGLGPTLNAIAKEMGKTSQGLKEGLSDGSVSVDQFTDALIRMDEEGGGGMKSLQTIVKDATKGISTGWQNAKTAFARGSASILESIDKVLEELGYGGIADVMGKLGKAVEGGMKNVAQFIKDNQETISSAIQFMADKFSMLFELIKDFNWGGFIEGLMSGTNAIIDFGKSVANFISPIIDVLVNLVSMLGGGDFATGLGKLIPILFGAGIAFKFLGKAIKAIGKFKGGSLFSGLFGGKSGTSGNGITDPVSGIAESFDFSGFLNKASTLALIAGAGGALMVVVEALSQLNDKIPEDLEMFGKKLAIVGVAILGMAGIMKIVGKLPILETGVGLLAIALMAGDLMIVAEAMKQLNDKVPSDVDLMVEKLKSLGLVFGAFAGVVVVVGGLVASGIGALVAGAGLATIALMALDLMLVAEAIAEFDSKVPEDLGRVVKKIEVMDEILDSLNRGNIFTAILDLVKHAIQLADTAIIVGMVDNIVTIAKSLNKLQKINLKYTSIKKNITSVNKAIDLLGDGNGIIDGILNLFDNKIDSKYYNNARETIKKILNIADDLNELQGIKLTYKTINSKISSIKKTIDKLGELDFADVDIDAEIFLKAEGVVTNIISIAKSFDDLESITVDVSVITKKIEDITTMLKALSGLSYDGTIGTDLDAETFDEIKKSVDYIIGIINSMNELQELIVNGLESPGMNKDVSQFANIKVTALENKVKDIQEMLDVIGTIQFNYSNDSISVNNAELYENVSKSIATIKDIIAKVNELFDSEISGMKGYHAGLTTDLEIKIEEIQALLDHISSITFNTDSPINKEDFVENVVGSIKRITELLGVVDNLVNTDSTAMKGYHSGLITDLETKIEEIQEFLDLLATITFDTDSNISDTEIFTTIKESLNTLKEIITSMNEFAISEINNEGINAVVDKMQTAFDKIAELSAENNTFSLMNTITQVKNLATELDTLVTTFGEKGEAYGKSIVDGFTDSNFAESILEMINTLVNNILRKTTAFEDAGKRLGKNLASGFETGVASMASSINAQLLTMYTYSESFANLGLTLGQSLANAFNNATSNLNVEATGTASANGSNTIFDRAKNILPRSKGGIVPQYLATGGHVLQKAKSIFKPMGSDIIPAMLTPGEFVFNRKAVQTFGQSTLNKMNFDPKGAFRAMMGGYGTKIDSSRRSISTVNNRTNNDNRQVTINEGGKRKKQSKMKVHRLFRKV